LHTTRSLSSELGTIVDNKQAAKNITNMSATTASPAAIDETTDLSKQYETPLGLAHSTMQALKDRIKLHYDLASDYYLNLWYASLS
jgi:uncharacterized protein YfcZ (UPF0381/DUF406 family)